MYCFLKHYINFLIFFFFVIVRWSRLKILCTWWEVTEHADVRSIRLSVVKSDHVLTILKVHGKENEPSIFDQIRLTMWFNFLFLHFNTLISLPNESCCFTVLTTCCVCSCSLLLFDFSLQWCHCIHRSQGLLLWIQFQNRESQLVLCLIFSSFTVVFTFKLQAKDPKSWSNYVWKFCLDILFYNIFGLCLCRVFLSFINFPNWKDKSAAPQPRLIFSRVVPLSLP